MKHLKKNQYVPGPCIPILHFHIKSACSLTSIYQAAGGFFIYRFLNHGWFVRLNRHRLLLQGLTGLHTTSL